MNEESETLKRLGALLDIPDLGGEDWDLMYADSGRVEEFCKVYEREPLTQAEKVLLMELLVASYERYLAEVEFPAPDLEARISRLLEKDFDAHLETIEYWSALKSAHPERPWHVSPLMRRLLALRK